MRAVTLVLLWLSACRSQPVELVGDLLVGCDPSGKAPEDVCTAGFLQEAFVAWARSGDIAWTPGASFTVINSSGDFGSISVSDPIAVPSQWTDAFHRERWERESLEVLRRLPISHEVPAAKGRQPNLSDTLALLAVAMREAKQHARPVDFLGSGDFWFISLGFNTEDHDVPTTAQVREALVSHAMPWDPAGFRSVTWCGLVTTGQSGAKVAARDQLLVELLSVDGRPGPRLLSSCQGLYPPVPAQLLRVPEGANSNTPSSSSR